MKDLRDRAEFPPATRSDHRCSLLRNGVHSLRLETGYIVYVFDHRCSVLRRVAARWTPVSPETLNPQPSTLDPQP